MFANAIKDMQAKFGTVSINPLALLVNYGNKLFQERNEILGTNPNRYMSLFEQAWQKLASPEAGLMVTEHKKEHDQTSSDSIEAKTIPTHVAANDPLPPIDSHSVERHADAKIVPLQQQVEASPTVHMDISDLDLLQEVKHAEKRARDSEDFHTGGVPGFEVKKMKTEPKITDHAPTDQVEIIPQEEEESAAVQEIKDQTSSDNRNQEEKTETMPIYVIIEDSKPMQLEVPTECQAWKIAKAEEQLQTLTQPIAIADMMGCYIPPNVNLHYDQMIRLQEGGLTPSKCPREGSTVKPTIINATRKHILWRQEGWVEWDEMKFYASLIESVQPNCVIQGGVQIDDNPIGPVQLGQHIKNMMQWGTQQQQTRVVSYILHRDHWIPLCVETANPCVVYTTPMHVTWVRESCQNCWGYTDIQFAAQSIASVFPADCGFQTIGWMNAMIVRETTMTPIGVQVACSWRQLYSDYLDKSDQSEVVVKTPLVYGGMQSTQDELQRLVESHGP